MTLDSPRGMCRVCYERWRKAGIKAGTFIPHSNFRWIDRQATIQALTERAERLAKVMLHTEDADKAAIAARQLRYVHTLLARARAGEQADKRGGGCRRGFEDGPDTSRNGTE